MQLASVLPEAPEGFCVQTTVISAGTPAGNGELAQIARDGGRVVAVVPLPEPANALRWEPRVFRESSRLTYMRNQDILCVSSASKELPHLSGLLGAGRHVLRTQRMMSSHPDCRCSQIPVLRESLGETLIFETGDESFDLQDAAMQRSILGPGKFAPFDAGELRLIDLVNEYNDPILGAAGTRSAVVGFAK